MYATIIHSPECVSEGRQAYVHVAQHTDRELGSGTARRPRKTCERQYGGWLDGRAGGHAAPRVYAPAIKLVPEGIHFLCIGPVSLDNVVYET